METAKNAAPPVHRVAQEALPAEWQRLEAALDKTEKELERLKEFGITKAKVLEQGEKMFTGVQIANNSGQIVNQEKFNEALIALMEDRFAGGMEKQATTLKGVWSTVTGVTKSSLATIVGISSDGSIKAYFDPGTAP